MEPTDLSSPMLQLSRGHTDRRWLPAGTRLLVTDGVTYMANDAGGGHLYLSAGQSHDIAVAGRYHLWTYSDATVQVMARTPLLVRLRGWMAMGRRAASVRARIDGVETAGSS